MEKVRYMISDAATMTGVESHVLRYWEDELDLTIPRNEMGHRYYTRENIQEFQKIKDLKEQGYQLKAIRTILHNGETSVQSVTMQTVPSGTAAVPTLQPAAAKAPAAVSDPVPYPLNIPSAAATASAIPSASPAAPAVSAAPTTASAPSLSAEDRMVQFRELMSDIVGHAVAQNNEALSLNISQDVRESVLKEMNYLFREQEDAEEERFRKLDAAIRGSLKKKRPLLARSDKPDKLEKAERKEALRRAKKEKSGKQKANASIS